MFKNIYSALNIPPKKSLVEQLMKPQRKANKDERPKFVAYAKDAVHQADLLYLPPDNGYKYVLVVVDIHSRLADAEPLKKRTPDEVLKALKKIYSRKYLDHPKIILQIDNGTEFKGAFDKYFEGKTIIRRGQPNRHRQQGVVEFLNYIIGKSIFARLNQDQLLTGTESNKWVKLMPKVIKAYNDVKKANFKKINVDTIEPALKHINKKVEILKVGDIVRRHLDYPQDIDGKKIGDKFRAGDIRWEIQPRKITNILLAPNQPVMYTLEGLKNVSFTFNQLQKVTPTETGTARGFYEVEKLLERKKIKNKIFYKVKWKGYEEPTLEPRSMLIKDVPQMVKDYEKKNK